MPHAAESLHGHALAFGPIPSRRFGSSLGVNNIPPKHCTYSCTYCQVGPTPRTEIVRRSFHDPALVIAAVERRAEECRRRDIAVDTISFVPDGEPTLDANLGREIRGVRSAGVPITVITNGSLLWMPDVREDLAAADRVSIEVDTVDEATWRRLDRSHRKLELAVVLDGLREFARAYRGTLLTQTMLVDGVNDDEESVRRTAEFVAELAPSRAWLAVPTRPPAELETLPAREEAVVRAWATMSHLLPQLHLLAKYEEDAFAHTGDPIADLVAALAVHPMREEKILRDLAAYGVTAAALDRLVDEGTIVRVDYGGDRFLARRFGT